MVAENLRKRSLLMLHSSSKWRQRATSKPSHYVTSVGTDDEPLRNVVALQHVGFIAISDRMSGLKDEKSMIESLRPTVRFALEIIDAS